MAQRGAPIDFIGIGPARTATTWLHECLQAHPQLCLPQWDKKTHFFDLYYDRGLDWYDKQFAPCPAGNKRGEITETYIFYPEVAGRIKEHYPQARVFACLRNPVQRAVSAYLHLKRDGVLTMPFDEALVKFEKALVSDNLYHDLLAPYFDLFPPEQLHIAIFEQDLKPDPRGFLARLYGFIGVDDQFLPPMWDQVLNESVSPRFPLLNKALVLTHMLLREVDVYKYLTPLKELALVKKLRFKEGGGGGPVELSPASLARLEEAFAPQNEKLARLLGRDLSCWQGPPEPPSPGK